MRAGTASSLATWRRPDRLVGLTAALVLLSMLTLLVSGGRVRVAAPGLDLVLDTLTTVVALAVAALAWARFRDGGLPGALVDATAFLGLAVGNAIAAVVALDALDATGGPALSPSSEASLYLAVLARVAAASLLALGHVQGLGGAIRRLPPLAVVLASAAVLAVLAVLAPAWSPGMPPLVVPSTDALGLPTATSANVVLQLLGAGLFAVAAVLVLRRARAGAAVSDTYLAVGLVVAAGAQLHLTAFPSAYAGVLTGGDLLYLAFDLILLTGIYVETRAYIASLRLANAGLQRLREVEVERAAIEERARLSRELHDGLAQDLWLAKLKAGRLAAAAGLPTPALVLAGEVTTAVDRALAEARQAVMALRIVGEGERPLPDLVARSVEDFSERFGLRVEFTAPDRIPPIGTRASAELLRITQEALSNVRKHADATLIRVSIEDRGERMALTIRDNGRGFDPAAPGSQGVGLAGMRERAALVGASLSITSRFQDGTAVTVEVPVTPSTQPAIAAAP